MNKNKKNKRVFLSPPHLSGRELFYINQSLESNYITSLGPQVEQFEQRICEQLGFKYSLAVNSGTSAMHLALLALNIKPKDIILVSDLTFIGSVSPVMYLGAEPVFIDSETVSWNMDPQLLAAEISSIHKNGRKVSAVVVTDLYGQSANLEAMLEVCAQYRIPLVSDSAESLGATYKEHSVGSGATAAVFSFNGNKIITTSGGGILVSKSKKIIDKARFLSQQAREPVTHYEHKAIGFNYRMSNILAAIGLAQLEVLDDRVKIKRKIFARYHKYLNDLDGISFMPEAQWGKSNRWLTVILIDSYAFGCTAEDIRVALEHRNIESRPVWKPMHMQPIFSGFQCRNVGVGKKLFENGLCLPSGTQLSKYDQMRVINTIRNLHVQNKSRS